MCYVILIIKLTYSWKKILKFGRACEDDLNPIIREASLASQCGGLWAAFYAHLNLSIRVEKGIYVICMLSWIPVCK